VDVLQVGQSRVLHEMPAANGSLVIELDQVTGL